MGGVAGAGLFILLLGSCTAWHSSMARPAVAAFEPAIALPAPSTAQVDQTDIYHGESIADPYRWLEDDRDPAVIAWAAAQDARTVDALSRLPQHRTVAEQLQKAWDFEQLGVIWQRGRRQFFMRDAGDQPHPAMWVKDAPELPPRLLLEPSTLTGPQPVALANQSVSPDGNHLAYATSESGTDWQRWRIRRISDGVDLSDLLVQSKFSSAAWTADSLGFYYTHYSRPAADAPLSQPDPQPAVYHHLLGQAETADRFVFRHPDPTYVADASTTEDGHWLIVRAAPGDDKRNQLWIQNLRRPGAPILPLVPRLAGTNQVVGSDAHGVFLLTTEGAPRGQLLHLPLQADGASAGAAQTIVAQGANPLRGVAQVGGHFVLHYLADAHSLVEVVDQKGQDRRRLELPGIGAVSGFDGVARSPITFYAFTSPVTPVTVYRLDARTLASTLVFRPKFAAGPHELVTEQKFLTSPDGTGLTLFISHRRDLRLDGSHRVRLYGYGGFNLLTSIDFSPSQWLWMQRGGIYVSAVIRGGGEYGDAWHRDGMLDRKQHVFDDFVAVADHLVAQGYTVPQRLGIEGSSNGGLLTAACLIQQPEKFGAVLVNAGVLDMLRYERFTCGRDWAAEYGSVDDPQAYATLRRYSPLHRVQKGTAYPATLIITGDHDDRVVPAHSFKFAAALQAAQSAAPPILLRVLPGTGHGAGRSRKQRLEVAADILSFFEATLR